MVGLERLLIGRSLAGRYAVQELIGPGRAGLVYRAHDAERDADVAVKVLNAPRAPEARERFRQLVAREVAAASAVRHPHVAAVYGIDGDAELDLDFVVSELMRGQSLAGVLSQRGKPPISLGLRLLGDAAEGLAAAHAAGLVHRDLRPGSLYLVRGEAERHVRVKITGFGVPQLVRRESLAVAAPEIRAYASPEMLANGSARLTPASDVFSLGMIGFELMTGALALDDAARTAMADGRAVEIEPPAEVAASVPPHVMDAVLQALRMDPAERFADGAAFAAAVREPAPRVVSVPRIVSEPEPQPVAQAAPVAEAAPAAEAVPSASDEATPTVAAAAIIAMAAAAAGDDEPVAQSASVAESSPAVEEAVMETAPAADAPVVAEETVMETPPAAESPVVAAEAVAAAAQAEAVTPDAEQPSAPAVEAPAPAHPRAAPPKRQVGDLELYYPPAKAKTPEPEIPLVVAPIAASAAAPESAAAAPVEEPPAEIVAPVAAAAAAEIPVAAAAAIPVVAEAEADAPSPVVDEAPAAEALDDAATAAAVAVAPAPRALKLIAGGGKKAGPGTFRAPPAMAAGFVLGILVLGSVAWIATRHTPAAAPASATTTLAANATSAAPAPNAAAPAATPSEATPPPAAADTVAKTPAQQAALDAAKKKAEDDRRRQEEEKARQAALLQQQQRAAATAQQPQQPVVQAPVQQPQARPQQVAVAPPPAPPPPPPPAPAPAREEAAPARASNEVYDIDVVEERPRLTNAAELQRALNERYPQQLASNRVSGRVTATFVVGTDGRVDPSSIRILNSPNQGFNSPTQGVIRRARFRPATVKGQAVRVQVTMPITWSLDGQ